MDIAMIVICAGILIMLGIIADILLEIKSMKVKHIKWHEEMFKKDWDCYEEKK